MGEIKNNCENYKQNNKSKENKCSSFFKGNRQNIFPWKTTVSFYCHNSK